jgi:arsenite methyltransferase
MVAIASNQRDVILDAVQAMYTDVAKHPGKEFHFPTGASACLFVGYPGEVLTSVPAEALESFAGVGYPFVGRVIRTADTVLDVGSGSGTDVIIAGQVVGEGGKVLALDMTPAMREKLRRNVELAGLDNVDVLEGNAEKIPLPDQSVDVVTSNGVINLIPDKARAFEEVYRVLRPGGRLQLSDIVVGTLPSASCRSQPELWAECVVGAVRETDYLALLERAGFVTIEILSRHDYFAGSSSQETRQVASSFGAQAVTLRAMKPTRWDPGRPSHHAA